MISRLPVFYKERDNLFYPTWAWSISSWILRVPYSILEVVAWACVVYYTVGFVPSIQRFFQSMLLPFSSHQMTLELFRMITSITRDMVVVNTFGSAALLIIFCSVDLSNQKTSTSLFGNNETVRYNILHSVSLAATIALRKTQTIIPLEDANLAEVNGSEDSITPSPSVTTRKKEKGMILPFKPLAMTFHDKMKENGLSIGEKKL
ncbi:hypothetical protein IC582_016717 [Cucumis melo]